MPGEQTSVNPDSVLLARTLIAHGGARYDRAAYRFTFRDKEYTFRNGEAGYTYTRTQTKDALTIVDSLVNGNLSRTIDGEPAFLSAKEQNAFANSVIYFATLPHKLQDPAVNIEAAGEQTVKGETYDLLRVHFDAVGGGKDHEDNFVYWINRSTDRIDYLAYDYRTNGGGVRFRAAYNPRIIGGILFQDYVNYEAPTGTRLEDLSGMYERGALEELSRVATENVNPL